MKYIYIDRDTDRVAVISSKRLEDQIGFHEEFQVPDTFDLGKDMPGESGGTVRMVGFLSATEFLERFNADHVAQRIGEYPPITDYIDGVVKGDQAQIDAYIAACQAVKTKYPKV